MLPAIYISFNLYDKGVMIFVKKMYEMITRLHSYLGKIARVFVPLCRDTKTSRSLVIH